MDWLIELLGPHNTALASTLVLYSFVIAAGVFLGKLKIAGVSLGVTFVLFVGILMGHFGYEVNAEVLTFVREFGLILFIFSIGLQVGPGFFSSFKKGGVRLNALAVLGVLLNVGIVLAIFYIDGKTDIAALVGVMSGAVTNTPGLAAAQQTAGDLTAINTMANGYAAAYPLGVVGIILAMLIIKAAFRVNMQDEVKALEEESNDDSHRPCIRTYTVDNPLIVGKNLQQLHDILKTDFVISRMRTPEGQFYIPNSKSVLVKGEHLFACMAPHDEAAFEAVVGPKASMEREDWEKQDNGAVVSRRILVTKSEYNGTTLRQLHLHAAYRLNVTRVNRAGVDLLASPILRLQMGDRLTVVGDLKDINRLAEKLGNSMKRLHHPNIITIFVGILLGIVLGSLPLGFGMKLGLAGGPLVVAILLSRFGYKIKLVTYTSTSASMLMRELGICLFLASVGIGAGKTFASAVFSPTGMWWVIWGFIITFVPLLVVGLIARGVYKLNLLTIMGTFAGTYTDPPALAYSTGSTGSDAPAVAYSTVYPLTMFLRVVAAQALILCLY